MGKKFGGIRLLAAVIGLSFSAFAPVPAQAVLVSTTVQGSVDFAHSPNPFGLTTGDSVTAVAVYDDVLVPAAGAFTLPVDSNAAFSLTITFGSFTYQETDNLNFGSGDPELAFNNGDLSGLEFLISNFAYGGESSINLVGVGDTEWAIALLEQALVGTWDFASAVTVPVDVVTVSEPGSLRLFAAGFAGLIGLSLFGRRRQRLRYAA